MAKCPEGKEPQREKSKNVQKAFRSKGEIPKMSNGLKGTNTVVNMTK